MIKATGGQRLDLLGVRKEDLPKVWADLDMPSGYAYGKSFRTVKTCGTDYCRFGLGDSTALGIALGKPLSGLESPAKLKLAVTGCPRNCAESLCKDFGVVAIGEGRWEIYVGGAAGAHIRKGDVLATVNSPDEVIRLCGLFIQYYREQAKWLERTYAWVPRVGIEELRAIRRRPGWIVAGLQQRIDEAVAGTSTRGSTALNPSRPPSSRPRCRCCRCRWFRRAVRHRPRRWWPHEHRNNNLVCPRPHVRRSTR